MKDANPLEGEGAQRGLMSFAFGALLLVEGSRPERARDGQGSPLDEGLSQEGWTLPPPVDPVRVSTTFGDGCDAGVSLHLIGAFEAFALFAKGDQESGSEGRSGGGEAAEDMKIGMLGSALTHRQ